LILAICIALEDEKPGIAVADSKPPLLGLIYRKDCSLLKQSLSKKHGGSNASSVTLFTYFIYKFVESSGRQ
jgi:hypothetical protein